jgi:tight adherence protein C
MRLPISSFFLGRTALAVRPALLLFLFAPVQPGGVGLGGIAGYLGPSLYIDKRIKTRKAEHQSHRVGRELSDSYPSLTANLHMTNLEIRAGRTMSDALETLIQQSAELDSSITEALRVYSDDMRHKRLSRAEEKAYALPAKLTVPMMVCIFPVLFVVILLPVFVRLHVGNY